jgi:hypothetical protein
LRGRDRTRSLEALAAVDPAATGTVPVWMMAAGRLPDASMQKCMIAGVEDLPRA